MKVRVLLVPLLVGLILGLSMSAAAAGGSIAPSSETAITYQGRLMKDGQPVNGHCDIRFSLWDTASGGNFLGQVVQKENFSIEQGLVMVTLDFGKAVFTGEPRWMQIELRCPAGQGSYVNLGRMPLTAAPSALSLPGLWSQKVGGSYNLVGGSTENWISEGAEGAVIGGGGNDNHRNLVTDAYGAVCGGAGNQAGNGLGTTQDAAYATVSGGLENQALGSGSTVGGGGWNGSSQGGNQARATASTIGGGFSNLIYQSAAYATIGGGYRNQAQSGRATIAGGEQNVASGYLATIAGGFNNEAGFRAAVGGGDNNKATGARSVIPGGSGNQASGDYSFAAGRRAKAQAAGCFVWGGSNDRDVSCTQANKTVFRSTGGYVIYTYDGGEGARMGVFLSPAGSSWNQLSDRNAKEHFQPVDKEALLERLAQIDIATWNYKGQDPAIRHIGPTAQDFNALLPDLGGEGETYINAMDADGVALAAIQALYQRSQRQAQRIAELEEENATLKAQLADLAERLARLEAASQTDAK